MAQAQYRFRRLSILITFGAIAWLRLSTGTPRTVPPFRTRSQRRTASPCHPLRTSTCTIRRVQSMSLAWRLETWLSRAIPDGSVPTRNASSPARIGDIRDEDIPHTIVAQGCTVGERTIPVLWKDGSKRRLAHGRHPEFPCHKHGNHCWARVMYNELQRRGWPGEWGLTEDQLQQQLCSGAHLRNARASTTPPGGLIAARWWRRLRYCFCGPHGGGDGGAWQSQISRAAFCWVCPHGDTDRQDECDDGVTRRKGSVRLQRTQAATTSTGGKLPQAASRRPPLVPGAPSRALLSDQTDLQGELDAKLNTADVDTDITTLDLPANTTITAFAQTFLDDADQAAVQATLDVDPSGTDNSDPNVTLAGTRSLQTTTSLPGTEITRNAVVATDSGVCDRCHCQQRHFCSSRRPHCGCHAGTLTYGGPRSGYDPAATDSLRVSTEVASGDWWARHRPLRQASLPPTLGALVVGLASAVKWLDPRYCAWHHRVEFD